MTAAERLDQAIAQIARANEAERLAGAIGTELATQIAEGERAKAKWAITEATRLREERA